MPDDSEKKFELELTGFGSRNKQRFHIMEDLTLTCDMCKTPEAKRSIQEMTRKYFQELQAEERTLNKKVDQMLKDAAKKGGKDGPGDNAALEKKAKQLIDKFTSVHLSNNAKLKLKFNGLKKPPYLIFEMKF